MKNHIFLDSPIIFHDSCCLRDKEDNFFNIYPVFGLENSQPWQAHSRASVDLGDLARKSSSAAVSCCSDISVEPEPLAASVAVEGGRI